MTREEAIKLQVGKDKAYVVEPKQEKIFEIFIIGVNIDIDCKPGSELFITGYCAAFLSTRKYAPRELCGTEIEALQKLVSIHQFKADQALNKKHDVVAKIARLKKKERQDG